MTNGNNGDLAFQEPQDLKLDQALLFRIVRRRRWLWLVAGLLFFVAGMGLGLYLSPQSYQSSLSVAMPTQKQSGGLGALLTGGAKTSYVGVLRSRTFAEQAAQRFDIKGLYNLDTQEDAVEMLQKGLVVEDSAGEGLIYVRITLPGPARLAPDPKGQGARVKRTAADIANFYASLLLGYMKERDVDEASALLRAADAELKETRNQYRDAIGRLTASVRRSLGLKAESTPITSRDAATQAIVGELEELYKRRGVQEEQLASAQRGREARNRLLKATTEQLLALPGEDRLLMDARREVREANTALQTAKSKYRPTMPQYIEAQERFDSAMRALRTQATSYIKGQTDESVSLEQLQAQRAKTQEEIERAERDFENARVRYRNAGLTTGRADLDVDIARREVEIAAAAYKTTSEKHAELKLTHASAKNRMTVVDRAVPARKGKPGALMITFLSLGAAMTLVFALFAGEYLFRALAAAQRAALQGDRVG